MELKFKKYDWFVIFAIILLSVLICFLSCPSPLSEYAYGIDNQVYRMMAILMKKGFVPYRDFFDHKGILLYFINFLGITISKQNGIWFLEVLFLSASIIGIYLIAKRHLNVIDSCMILACLIHVLFYYFDYGNQPDFYSLFFIICGLYVYTDYFETSKTNCIKLIICGLSFACVSMMKLNLVFMWLIYSLTVLVKCLVERKIENIWFFLIWFLVGTAIVYIPILVYLLINNSLNAYIECYLLFNSKYTSVAMKAIFDSTMSFVMAKRFLISFLSYFLLIFDRKLIKKNIYILIASFITLVLAPFITNMSGMGFKYYGFSLIYTYFVPLILLFCILDDIIVDRRIRFACSVTVVALLSVLDFTYMNNTLGKIQMFADKIIKNEKIEIPEQYLKINSYIRSNSKESDGLLVCGNSCYVYELTDRVPNNRYMYQLIFLFNNSLTEPFVSDLKSKRPKIIVFEKGYEEILIDVLEFIDSTNYKKVFETENYIVFQIM